MSVYMRHVGLSASETALIRGSMPILGAFMRPLVGALADRLHRHQAALIACCVATGVLHAGLLLVPPAAPARPRPDKAPRVSIDCRAEFSVLRYCTDTRRVGRDCYVAPDGLLNVTGTTPDPALNASECKLQCELLLPPDGATTSGICFAPFSFGGSGREASEEGGDRKDCVNSTSGRAPDLEFVLEELNHTLTQYTFEEESGESLVCHSYAMAAFLFNGTAYRRLACDRATRLRCSVVCDRFSGALARSRCTAHAPRDPVPRFGRTFRLFLLIDTLATAALVPIVSLMNAITYGFLGDDRGQWGRQRMWGTVGFALFGATSGCLMYAYGGIGSDDGIIINNNNNNDSNGDSGDGVHALVDHNYTLAFGGFALLNLVTALSVCQYRISGVQDGPAPARGLCARLLRAEMVALFALVYTLGCLNGVTETFLFWYLQGLGASRLLMGGCLLMGCLPEVPTLAASGWVIARFGHVRCLCAVCVGYAARCGAYALLGSPMLALAVEPLQGVSFGLMYATATSYASLLTPPGMHGTTQGILSGLYFGFGKGTGSVVGGFMFDLCGPRNTFLGCSAVAGCALVLYTFAHGCIACRDQRMGRLRRKLEQQEEAKAKAGEVTMLNAPIGWGPTTVLDSPHPAHPEIPRYSNGMVRDSHSRTPLVAPLSPLEVERPLPPETSV